MLFDPPITYAQNTRSLLIKCQDDLELKILYENILGKSQTKKGDLRKSWLQLYTTDVKYLKDTQKLVKGSHQLINNPVTDIEKLWASYNDNLGFRDKYEFITFEQFYGMNKSESILQAISMYTLMSPILSLISPILMLLIPFFIIRIKGVSLTIGKYLDELKIIFSKMPLGQLFNLKSSSWDQRIFIMVSIIFYFVQMYQNTVTCYKFYKNTNEMYETLQKLKDYCESTIKSMDKFKNFVDENEMETYTPFVNKMMKHREKLSNMMLAYSKLKSGVFKQMGLKMKYFYEMYCGPDFYITFFYSLGFNEYISNIKILGEMREINQCKFTEEKSSMKNSYYGPLVLVDANESENQLVKNTYSLSKNAIISGPNASGKTTVLKSTMFNFILSQQIGYGFYDSANIVPQDHFHCYINIPDTCSRDSLFQAEVRRCKQILDTMERYPEDKHFCVFDELFSGTNPYEAVASAVGYLSYIHKFSNIKYMLTTHYIDLCNNFKKNKFTTNYTTEKPYTLKKGISKVKGGIKVLKDQKFPEQVLKIAQDMVS